eukprot:1971977-Rhodomonas_salina.3
MLRDERGRVRVLGTAGALCSARGAQAGLVGPGTVLGPYRLIATALRTPYAVPAIAYAAVCHALAPRSPVLTKSGPTTRCAINYQNTKQRCP